ncbi:hypothetical protein I4U23_010881 [Adineta vaga]|nr:hypothetical protein I4U23_010881 [Adineta vaga]
MSPYPSGDALFKEHPHVAWSLWFIGLIFKKMNESDIALGYLERALKMFETIIQQKEHHDVQKLEEHISQTKQMICTTDSNARPRSRSALSRRNGLSELSGQSLPVIIGSSVGGVLASILLILDLIAIFELLTSSGRSVCSKLIWILIIFFFPIGGLVLYWCCARHRTVDEVIA